MLRGGTTTCHDMYFFLDSAAKALREVGLRVVQGAFVIKYPNAEYKGEEDAFGGARALAARHKDDPAFLSILHRMLPIPSLRKLCRHPCG